MVADLWNAGSGGAASCFGGRPDHRPLTDEKGGTTATSPSRETGSIGSAGLARSGLASGDWQRISTGAGDDSTADAETARMASPSVGGALSLLCQTALLLALFSSDRFIHQFNGLIHPFAIGAKQR